MKNRLWVFLGFYLVAVNSGFSAEPSVDKGKVVVERVVKLDKFFHGINPEDATFVLLNAGSGEIARYNPARASKRFLPASTFKIPNSLIALETGVASGSQHTIKFDSAKHRRPGGFWAKAWSQDHTLRSAINNSVVWYYQELAREIGPERMKQYLSRFDYGNQNMEGGIDRFWLDGGLRISPDEQVQFLRRIYYGELGLSKQTTQVIKDILLLEETPAYRLSGKTGTADVTPTRELAWLVGYVERNGNIWFYALNVEGEQVWEQWGPPARRLTLLRSLLRESGVIPDEVGDRPSLF